MNTQVTPGEHLTDFLLARIAEDEATARAADRSPRYEHYGPSAIAEMVALALNEGAYDEAGDHALRHEPARVLAECEAKRRIVKEVEKVRKQDLATPGTGRLSLNYSLDVILKTLALPYAGHPDYREDWRP